MSSQTGFKARSCYFYYLYYSGISFFGYLIGSSIPIGVTSIIWTSLVKGDLGISFVAVTLDTFVVPTVLPLFFHIAVGQTININYSKMIIDLMFMVTVPSIIGMLLYDWTKSRETILTIPRFSLTA